MSKSQAYNAALEYASGGMILFLNCDAYITDRTIVRLEDQLYSNENIAAVGPVLSKVEIDNLQRYSGNMPKLKDIFQAREFSDQLYQEKHLELPYNTNFLYDYCLLIKKDIILSVGNFDIKYYANSMEDIDLSLRLIKAGYKLLVVPSVFVYNDHQWPFIDRGYDHYDSYAIMTNVFEEKWKFNFIYSSNLRNDLLKYIDCGKENLAILETGCAMGANFTYIKAINRSAELCGIELCDNSAFFAKEHADVRSADLEKIEVPEWNNKFDYITLLYRIQAA